MKTQSALPGRTAAFLPLPVLAAALLASAVGCEPADEIATYETRRTEPRVTAVDPDAVRAIQDHMFAAVIPDEGKAWFFKLVVPGADADALREPFDKFLATVDVSRTVPTAGADSGDAAKEAAGPTRPAWKLPEGWTEEPGGLMRAATIAVPHNDKKFEITVSSLPLSGAWADFLKINVDRWMDQLQQPHLPAGAIKSLAHQVPTVSGDATRFELVGAMMKNPMGGAMSGMPAGHPPVSARTPERDATEGSDAAPPDQAAPAVAETLAVDTPPGWEATPPPPGPFKREASFKVAAAGGQADLAVTKFAAFGEMAALGPNVRRWAGQVGVLDLTEDAIIEAAQKVVVGGQPALQFEFSSPEETSPAKSILAVMAKRGDQVWFFKLFGDKATVESQRDAFKAFLKSARFTPAE